MGTKVVTHILFKKLTLSLLMASLVLTSCVQNSGVRSKIAKATGSNLSGTGTGTGTGVGALPTDTTGTPTALQSVKVELSHLVDPFDGTYKKKLTIPKNFKGNLYLAGLNIAALQDKLIKVRFNFGVDNQSVTLNATVARAPGIVPQTDIQVLVVDMNSKPFNKMRLGYDLFDYNDYSVTSSTAAGYLEPVTDPRNGGLYCRGLKLESDPSYDNTKTTVGCNSATDKCLYAYAKISDATLYTTNLPSTGLTSIPTRPQVWTGSDSSRSPSYTVSASTMCLPDSNDPVGLSTLYNDPTITGLLENYSLLGLFYRGPYRAINASQWQIQGSAIFNNETGLYKDVGYTGYTGWRSFLFPIAGKLQLNQGVSYQGSDDRFTVRGNKVADNTGVSKYVDGCNIRVMNYDPATTESIGSCNVNGSIEIFYLKDGAEVSITKDTNIKLQLLRPSLTNFEGKEVLTSAFKRCESSSTCGTDECCFNSRCWSKELVTQCVDQTPVIGNQEIGANCSSDYECSSLCCNQSTGSCAPHNPNGTTPILCSKTAGQRCVSREFCKPEYVATCKIVKLPTLNPDGTVACTLRCPAVETYGSCTGGYCLPPVIPPVPVFDPKDCSKAVDP